MECHSCGHRIIGLGCTKNNIRVTDHNSCGEWAAIKQERTTNDLDAIEQYAYAGYELRLDVIEP